MMPITVPAAMLLTAPLVSTGVLSELLSSSSAGALSSVLAASLDAVVVASASMLAFTALTSSAISS
jgi:hypothetical protein